MTTFALCLIYYGLAVWAFQLIGWFSDGVWTPYPIREAWEAFVGPPSYDSPELSPPVEAFLNLPLGLSLTLTGLFIISTRFTSLIFEVAWAQWERRRWILEQCKKVGLYPWVVPEIIEELKREKDPNRGKFEKRIR